MNRNSTWGRRFNFASLYGYASSVGGTLGGVISGMDTESKMDNYRYCMSAFVSALTIFIMISIFSTLTVNEGKFIICNSFIFCFINYLILFFGGSAILGVILGILYVVTDTQSMIFRAKNNGNSDVVTDAKLLFVDLVKIFYKLYEYMQKKDKEKKKKKEK